MNELLKKSATEQSKALKNKEISAVELTNAAFERIDNLEGKLGAFNSLTKETALETAKKVDEKIAKGEELPLLAGIREDIKKNPADLNLRMQESEKTKVLNNLLAMKRNWAVTGATTIPLIFRAQWNTAKQSLNQAKTKAQALANTGSTETYQQAYNKAQREYNAAKKKVAAMERNKSKYTATQYETATQNLKAAKDAYSKLGGDVSGKVAKAAATARKTRIKEENKAIKAQEDLNNRLKALQQKNIPICR